MQAFYPLKIQAICSKGQQARLYVYFPLFGIFRVIFML